MGLGWGGGSVSMGPSDIVSTDGSMLVTPSGAGVELSTQWTHQEYVVGTAVPITTSNAPASAVEWLRIDDGAGGDIVISSARQWQLTVTTFFVVSASSTSLFFDLEFNIAGGGWTAFSTPVIDQIGIAGGATSETAVGDLPPFWFDVPIQLRFVFAKNGGPGGSTVTAERGRTMLEIVG